MENGSKSRLTNCNKKLDITNHIPLQQASTTYSWKPKKAVQVKVEMKSDTHETPSASHENSGVNEVPSTTLNYDNHHYCDHCNTWFLSAAHYKLHEGTHNKEKAMQCDMCGMTFTRVAEQLLHMIYCKKTEVRLHSCTTCGESFKTQKALWDHIPTHTGITYPCNICDRVFPVQELLSRHQAVCRYSKTKVPSHSCTTCGESFKTQEALWDHVPIHTVINYRCNVCNQVFPVKELLSRHQAGCRYCKYCKKYFTSAKMFENHIKTWSHYIKMDAESQNKQKYVKENVLRCPICEKSFRQKWRFQRHVVSHEQNLHKLPQSCDQCGKRFPILSVLKIHQKECRKQFKETHHLQRHSSIHSAERPFKCDHCDWTFKLKNSLKRHMLMHSNIKTSAPARYPCRFCNISYSRECRLMDHMIALHSKTLLECYFCPLNFCYRSTLEEHERLHLDGML